MKLIQSTKNPELKQLRLLFEKARERKKKKLFVIEGEREIKKAILSDYSFTQVFMEDGSAPVEPEVQTLALHTPAFRVERKAFERISKRQDPKRLWQWHRLNHMN